METGALFIVAQVLHVRCGAVLNVLWNADNDEAPNIPPDASERGVRVPQDVEYRAASHMQHLRHNEQRRGLHFEMCIRDRSAA